MLLFPGTPATSHVGSVYVALAGRDLAPCVGRTVMQMAGLMSTWAVKRRSAGEITVQENPTLARKMQILMDLGMSVMKTLMEIFC